MFPKLMLLLMMTAQATSGLAQERTVVHPDSSEAFASAAETDSITAAAAAAAPRFWIRHPEDAEGRRISGDGRTVFLNRSVLLFAQVVGSRGEPVPDLTVYFHAVAPMEKNLGSALTDQRGMARVEFTAGNQEGTQTVLAMIPGEESGENRIVYHLQARKRSWVLFMLFGLAGGLGLFLYGMNMMSSSLQRSAGGRMRAILGALTRNRLIGLGVGAFVTMMVQSSSATTVMLVSFVQAGLMSFAQTLGVILGADIGTTVTAQLIAFKLTDYALLIIALGFGLRIFGRIRSLRNLGEVMLGFGMLFFGMHIMSLAMEPLRSFAPFLGLLKGLENPLLGILVGTVFTALIQSSSAFTGIVIVLAQQGFLTLDAGIPLILGANVGTCITAALASMNAGREAKRVALAHTSFKVAGVLLMVWWIPWLADLVRGISGGAVGEGDTATLSQVIPRQIANAHTIFNVGIALVFLPFTRLFARMVLRLMPDLPEPEIEERLRARHLEKSLLSTPALALNLAKVEILRMGDKVAHMVEQCIHPFLDGKVDKLDALHASEEEVDALDAQISDYLINIGRQDLNEEQAEEVYLMMHVTKQYELIADIVDKELRPLAMRKVSRGITFSESGAEEVRRYHLKAMKQISRSMRAFKDGSLERAQRVALKQAKYVHLAGDYRRAHFERIHRAVEESLASSEIHLDLMDSLRKVNSYSANIARALLARFEAEEHGAEPATTGKQFDED